jgi:hypothetical protein
MALMLGRGTDDELFLLCMSVGLAGCGLASAILLYCSIMLNFAWWATHHPFFLECSASFCDTQKLPKVLLGMTCLLGLRLGGIFEQFKLLA